MGIEQNKIDIDPADKLVIDAVAVISRKGTRENRKKAYEEQLIRLRIKDEDSLNEKVDKMRALTKLRETRGGLLSDPEPDSPSLDFQRGSGGMAQDPAGKR